MHTPAPLILCGSCNWSMSTWRLTTSHSIFWKGGIVVHGEAVRGTIFHTLSPDLMIGLLYSIRGGCSKNGGVGTAFWRSFRKQKIVVTHTYSWSWSSRATTSRGVTSYVTYGRAFWFARLHSCRVGFDVCLTFCLKMMSIFNVAFGSGHLEEMRWLGRVESKASRARLTMPLLHMWSKARTSVVARRDMS